MRIHELDGFLKTGEAEPDMWLQLTFVYREVFWLFEYQKTKKDHNEDVGILIVANNNKVGVKRRVPNLIKNTFH
jgi:hypothetical protein